MDAMEARLGSSGFMRINRSVILNLSRIKELQPWFAGDYVVILRDGRQLKLDVESYNENRSPTSRSHGFRFRARP